MSYVRYRIDRKIDLKKRNHKNKSTNRTLLGKIRFYVATIVLGILWAFINVFFRGGGEVTVNTSSIKLISCTGVSSCNLLDLISLTSGINADVVYLWALKIFSLKPKTIKPYFTWHFVDLHKCPEQLNFKSKLAY